MIVLAFLSMFAVIGCAGGEAADKESAETAEKKPARPDPRTLVEVAPVERGSVARHLVASATVESERQADLVPETQGTVTGIYVEEGDTVAAGQLLAVVASPALDAAYERATAELERAQRDAAAAERLLAGGAMSRQELDAATQALRAASTAHEEASRTRGFTRIESPIAGTVAKRNVRYGEMAAGQTAFTIVDLARLRVVVALPERDLPRVRAGQPAVLESVYDDGVRGAGSVDRVSPTIDTGSGTFRATVRLAEDTALRPGQYVRVNIEVDRHDDVLTVSRRALVWDEGEPFVFRVADMTAAELEEEKENKKKDDEGKGGAAGSMSFSFGAPEEKEEEPELPGPARKATRVRVKVGFEDGERAEIVEGLAPGDAVVVVGNDSLREGARVRLPGDPTVASTAEPAPKAD